MSETKGQWARGFIEDMMGHAVHTHQASSEGMGDRCHSCGHDIRHPIHSSNTGHLTQLLNDASAPTLATRIEELETALETIANWTHNMPYDGDVTVEAINDYARAALTGEGES